MLLGDAVMGSNGTGDDGGGCGRSRRGGDYLKYMQRTKRCDVMIIYIRQTTHVHRMGRRGSRVCCVAHMMRVYVCVCDVHRDLQRR